MMSTLSRCATAVQLRRRDQVLAAHQVQDPPRPEAERTRSRRWSTPRRARRTPPSSISPPTTAAEW